MPWRSHGVGVGGAVLRGYVETHETEASPFSGTSLRAEGSRRVTANHVYLNLNYVAQALSSDHGRIYLSLVPSGCVALCSHGPRARQSHYDIIPGGRPK